MRSAALWLVAALSLGVAAARCVRGGGDRLSRAPRGAHAHAANQAAAVNLTALSDSPFADEHALRLFLDGEYERGATDACNKANDAEWNYNTDLLNPATTEAYVSLM